MFKQSVTNLSLGLQWLIKDHKHYTADYNVISIIACGIRFRRSMLNL